MKQDGVQLTKSVYNGSCTSRTQSSLESNTIDSSPLVFLRRLSAAKCSVELPGVHRLGQSEIYLTFHLHATGRSTDEYAAAARLLWVSISTME